MKKINIGMLGLGNVGAGSYRILEMNRKLIEERTGADLEFTRILVRDKNKKRPVEVPASVLTENPRDVLDDPDVDIVIEVLGGIEPAGDYMLRAIKNGKHVVTANKAALAARYEELTRTAEDYGVMLRYEASVGGAIPVLNALSTALQANEFLEIMGILNGTTNYILTRMTEDGAAYEDVLRDAQDKGFAEADPTADVEGIDAANKLCILMALAFGEYVAPDDIPRKGITGITPADIKAAAGEGKKIKLIARAGIEDGRLTCSVSPVALPASHPLAGVSNEFNAVYVTGNASGELMFYGRGAGPLPTGSAVMGDVLEIAKNI